MTAPVPIASPLNVFASWAVVAVLLLGPSLVAEGQETSADPRLETAAELIVRFEFDAARDAFDQLRGDLTAGTPEHRQATFGLAVATQHRQPPLPEYIDEASRLYRELADDGTDDAIAARSLMNLGRVLELRDYQHDTPRPDEAIEVYERVRARFADRPIVHEAVFRIAGALMQQFEDADKVRRGVETLEHWLADHPDNPFAGGMRLALYDQYRTTDRPREALRQLVEGDRVGMPVPRVGEFYWQAGELARQLYADEPELLDTAVYFYTKTVVDTPSSGRAYQALDRLRGLAEVNPQAEIEIPEFVFGRAAAVRDE